MPRRRKEMMAALPDDLQVSMLSENDELTPEEVLMVNKKQPTTGGSILDLLDELEEMPEPEEVIAEDSDWNQENVLKAYLELTKFSRTDGHEYFKRRGFTPQEVARHLKGELDQYKLRKAVEKLQNIIGYKVMDDPTGAKTKGGKARQVLGTDYIPDSLLARGLLIYEPNAGNKGVGFGFRPDIKKIREEQES